MELREVVEYLSTDELAHLGGFHAAMLDVAEGGEPRSSLRAYLEYLSGRRSEAGWISDALNTDRDGALRAAAWAERAHVALPDDLTAALDARWVALTEEHARRLEGARAGLRRISDETPGAASLARDLASAWSEHEVPAERPRESAALERAFAAEQKGHGLSRQVDDVLAFAREELEESRTELVELGRNAFSIALERFVAAGGQPDSPEAAILRLVPELYLGRRRELLERVVRGEISADDAELMELRPGPVSAARSTARRSPMEMGAIEPSVTQSRAAIHPRSSLAQELLKRVTPSTSLSSGQDLREIIAKAQTFSPPEAATLLLGAGLATSDRSLRAAALGYGLLEHGRTLLDQGLHRFASEELRDAVELLAVGAIHGTAEAIDRAAHALVATIAWPRYRAVGGTHEQLAAWLESPRPMFSWLAAEGHLDIPAATWADFQDDAAAAAFFDAIRVECGRDDELLRAAAAALSSAKRLREYPERCCGRILWLLEPAAPSSELKAALTVIAQELASIDQNRPGPAASSFMRDHVERLCAELSSLPSDRGAVVEELQELLPSVLERLAGGSEVSPAHVVISPLVSAFFPAERSRNVDLPFVLHNQGGATATHLALRVAAVGDLPRPRFDDDKDAAERFIGDLQPGESRSVTFAIDLPVERTPGGGEATFQARLITGVEVLAERRISVEYRAGTRDSAINPYSTGERATPQHFIGREKEVRALIAALLGNGPNKTPLVVGIRRIGKTSILFRVKEDDEIRLRYLSVYVSAEDRPSSETTSGFLLYLCEQIHRALPSEARASIGLAAGDFTARPYDAFEAFVDALGRAGLKGRRVLLILDEADKLLALAHETRERQAREGRPLSPQEAFQPEVFGALRKALTKSGALRMVFAGLPQILQLTTYDDRLFGLLLPIWVRKFTEKEAALVLDEATRAGIRFAATQEAILQATGCQPYMLQLVCYNLFARIQSSGRDCATLEDLEHVVRTEILPYSNYFLDYERLIGDRDRPLLRALALRQRDVAARRLFVSVGEVARELQRRRIAISPEQVHERFRALQSDERPLVVQARNSTENYRLVIGMLGERLIAREDA